MPCKPNEGCLPCELIITEWYRLDNYVDECVSSVILGFSTRPEFGGSLLLCEKLSTLGLSWLILTQPRPAAEYRSASGLDV